MRKELIQFNNNNDKTLDLKMAEDLNRRFSK